MRILDRYIGFSVAYSTFFALLVLVALFTFLSFAGELNKIGKGDYDSWEAIQFAFFAIPSLLYQIFPAAALIGTMSGLGVLANNSELVAMRAAGYSLLNILRSVFLFSFILMVIVVLVGEYLAPTAQNIAETNRSIAMSGQNAIKTSDGTWLRDENQFIHVGKIADDGRLLDVRIFQLNEQHRLVSMKQIGSAVNFLNNKWLLSDFAGFRVHGDDISIDYQQAVTDDVFLSPEILQLVSIDPESMSAHAAYQYVAYLEENDIDASRYLQTFWSRVTTPLATFVMVMLAIPIVMGSTRSMTAGHRILVGTLTGISFYLISQIFSYVGLVFELSPVMTAFIPIILFSYVAIILLRRVK